jgi:hypothetical protein
MGVGVARVPARMGRGGAGREGRGDWWAEIGGVACPSRHRKGGVRFLMAFPFEFSIRRGGGLGK